MKSASPAEEGCQRILPWCLESELVQQLMSIDVSKAVFSPLEAAVECCFLLDVATASGSERAFLFKVETEEDRFNWGVAFGRAGVLRRTAQQRASLAARPNQVSSNLLTRLVRPIMSRTSFVGERAADKTQSQSAVTTSFLTRGKPHRPISHLLGAAATTFWAVPLQSEAA